MAVTINQIIKEYEMDFHIKLASLDKNSNNPIDDLIYDAKKYVSGLGLEEKADRELQKFFVPYIEGLYRRKNQRDEIDKEIKSMVETADRKERVLKYKVIGFSVVAGVLMTLITDNIALSSVYASIVGVATYFSEKKLIHKKLDGINNVVGSNSYLKNLKNGLHNNLLSEYGLLDKSI